MALNNTSSPVGVVGAGRFGTAVANMLAEKNAVLLFTRSAQKALDIKRTGKNASQTLHRRVAPTSSLEEVGATCRIIFPILPSQAFRETLRRMSSSLHPHHMLIHGTKGLDVVGTTRAREPISKDQVATMSQVILEETSVTRVGCLSGPNLSSEITAHQPAATVLASHFDEVVQAGRKLLKSDRFLVYGSSDLIGTELCGTLKNIVAIGAGMLDELGMGNNAKALLISRGLMDLVAVGKLLGSGANAFIGLSGIGDIIATCSSSFSRNFCVGKELAKGRGLTEILAEMNEVAEGIRTVEVVVRLAEYHRLKCVIPRILCRIMQGDLSVEKACTMLMKLPFQYEENLMSA